MMVIDGISHQDLVVGEDLAQGDKVGLNEPNVVVRRTDRHALLGVAGSDLKAGQRARLRNGWTVEASS